MGEGQSPSLGDGEDQAPLETGLHSLGGDEVGIPIAMASTIVREGLAQE